MSAITDDDVEPIRAEDDDSNEFLRLKRFVVNGHRARSGWRKETVQAYDYVANNPWSQTDLNLLKEQSRPAVSFNRTAPIIKAVCGLEVNNRQTVAYLPRKEGDGQIDEVRTSTVKWVRELCNAEDEESESFRDLAICGEGWVETSMCYDDDPKGRITELRIDPLEMGTDDGAVRSNYSDARALFRIRLMDSEEAKALFTEEYTTEALHAKWLEDDIIPADGGEGNKKDYPNESRAGIERDSNRRSKVRLVQIQWWDRKPFHLIAQEDVDEIQELSADDFAKFKDRAEQLRKADMDANTAYTAAAENHMAMAAADPLYGELTPPPEQPTPTAPRYKDVKVKKKVYYEAFLGTGILGAVREIKMGQFQFKAMTGDRDRTKKCFYGMLRDMFDPQMWANKWLSQTMAIMNQNAKGGIMAETDAFQNQATAEKNWADPSKIIWVKPNTLKAGKIKDRTPPPLPQGLADLMQFAIGSLRDVTGVNLELLGQADREQAAILETQRRQSAMVILATLFDSKRRFMKDQGRLLLEFTELLPEGTLVRVLTQGQYKFIPFLKNVDTHEYDVVIDQTPYSPDQKQAVWALTMQLIQGGVPLPPPVIIKLLKYSPYPESVVAEITEAMGLGATMPPEMLKQKLDQAEAALKVMEDHLQQALKENEDAKGDKRIELLEVAVKDYKAKTERLAAEWTAKISTIQALADAQATPSPAEGAAA